ncbi:LOW QUALITY PROTEIN: uncharacterized protein [Argopecten irradians]|uniref:LOW QUALITY PROTEIN: uncharacterized protein n=1 Tax=Argopecten irradians TaxID=31199 RepID=UPI003714E92F
MKEGSTGLRTVPLKRKKENCRQRNQQGSSLTAVSAVFVGLFLLTSSPFVGPQSRGLAGSLCSIQRQDKVTQVSHTHTHSGKVDQALVTVADPFNTGETSARTKERLSQTSGKNDFIKDEYSEFVLTDDYFEYEQGQANIRVWGRLRERIGFWERIGCSEFILNTIREGYKIPFYSTPVSVVLRNNRSAMEHTTFVGEAISELIARELVEVCKVRPYVVNPLTVSVQSSGKKRLILDLRHVNCHLWKTSVKFEDIRVAMQFIKKDAFCFKFDIHSAYHHVDIFEPHREFLGFSWNFGGTVKYFKFKVLPFGLSSACYIFTKLTRPLIKKWRSEGKEILMYLDDGLGTHRDEAMCTLISKQVKYDLVQSGFVPKPEKSTWIPVRQLVFLGNYIDTVLGILKIPDVRLIKLHSSISGVMADISGSGCVSVKKVSSVIGQIISMSYILGNIVNIMTRNLSMDVAMSASWNCRISLSSQSVEQLKFWDRCVEKINERKFTVDQSCQSIVYSDASHTGFGGYVVDSPMGTSHGMWSESEMEKSSTWRELVTVDRVLLSMLHLFCGKKVKWYTDNQNVVSIVNKGSMKADLQSIALSIFDTCVRNCISIDIDWVPRTENEKADYVSRIVDCDDWGVSSDIFVYLDTLWGPHEIDWFASTNNNKLPVFFSRYWNVGSSGTDAFTADWHGVNGWFVPPVCIVHRVLCYMQQCGAYGTMVVPMWRSASFWPFLCPSGDGFIPEVVGFIYLPTNKESYTPGFQAGDSRAA